MTASVNSAPRTGYASVNGLEMYYEVHGEGEPLVLLHGALSATGTSFGALLPQLSRSHQVISVEQQAHGHTADIDRPLTMPQMAKDTAALLAHLGVEQADIFGYSMGTGVAVELARHHPALIRRLVLASVSFNPSGLHPELLQNLSGLEPEHLIGTPWHEEYLRIAPRPEDFPVLVRKVTEMNARIPELTPEEFAEISAPTLIIIGDSDIIRPEHGVEMFRLLGGGVIGDLVGLPPSQLAILPGTPHSTLTQRADLLVPMIGSFLRTG